tara:strand:+ start:6170 stop:7795 length:1626 start_codon:yes stop_codon:yes gene_type:complete
MAKEILEFELKGDVKPALKDTEKLADNLEDVGTGAKKASGGFKSMGTAIKGLGTALKAAGIALIVAAFASLKVAMESNQKVMNTVSGIMTTISTTMNKVVNVLTDVVVWVTASSERFNGLAKVLDGMITLVLTPLKLSFLGIKAAVQTAMLAWEDSFLGGGDEGKIAELQADLKQTGKDIKQTGKDAVNAGVDIFNNFSDAVTEIGAIYDETAKGIKEINVQAIHEQSKAVVASKNAADLAMSQIAGVIAEKEREAELERQIRDDVSKTFEDRIAANDRLKTILEESQAEQLKLAALEVSAARKQLATNETLIEFKVALQEALNKEVEIQAAITGQLSEQKTNAEALKIEQLQARKDVTEATLRGVDLELAALKNEYDEKIKLAKLAGEDTVALEEEYSRKRTQITKDATLEQAAAYSQLAGALSSLAGDNKELAAAGAIIDTFAGANKAFREGGTVGFITGAAIIAAGLDNVRRIYATDIPGVGAGAVPAEVATPAPQMMSGAFELTGGQADQPIQAYVVSDDITNSQNGLAQIRRRATI